MTILLTGGSGRLGSALQGLIPGLHAPPRAALDITHPEQVLRALRAARPHLVVHAAALADVTRCERDRALAWQVNVDGAAAVARACHATGAALIHISTDYVFSGDTGHYRENDPPGPPVNWYGVTKLAAESAARLAGRSLIIRTSFRTRPFPHAAAFTDAFTSQDYLDVIAPHVAQVILQASSIPDATLHVATARKSVFDLARQSRPDVRPATRDHAPLPLPADVSLNTDRWQALRAPWETGSPAQSESA
ncbi:SDR family oxidoreductase [Deinococcus knuensis]|uniref:dTDP-4-dehydrorhamnose reductase n=1 Tax=Deinococcus knuensis TaxID=1837380 RepID=A0ABQ2SH63_9DEIO|nr:sugar nucleotide-binding protein [Deinococcus knuensis]GGS25425.1 dTDP-4-rhamnose reductase [Deinococcus knuensis]